MAGRATDLGWRDKAAAELLLRHLSQLNPKGPILVMGDPLPEVEKGLRVHGLEVTAWNRRALGGGAAAPWPPLGPFATITIRLPRSKTELAMTLAAAAGSLIPEGLLLIYGAKDEGVGSAPGLMGELFQEVETVGVGGRCRLLRGKRKDSLGDSMPSLESWREVHPLDYPGLPTEWVSYPGVFAQGKLDSGTRLLLGALPAHEEGARILDYGCGSGIVGAMALLQAPGATVHFLDVDSVALEAARENVPGGIFLLREGLPVGDEGVYDVILTNPPFHRGKAEDPEMVRELILKTPAFLSGKGRLILVAQKRLSLEDAFRRAYREVSLRAEDSGFRVWEGKNPSRGHS